MFKISAQYNVLPYGALNIERVQTPSEWTPSWHHLAWSRIYVTSTPKAVFVKYQRHTETSDRNF